MLPTLGDGDLTLRPLEPGEDSRLAEWTTLPSIAEWWGTPDPPEREREGMRNEGRAFAILVEGELAGWLCFDEENEPDYRHASVDIMLGPDHQDRGFGPRALRLAIGWLIDERGHHRVTIDPSTENERAIRAFRAVGFQPVGVLRSYDRRPDGRWGDGLLMDLLADELIR